MISYLVTFDFAEFEFVELDLAAGDFFGVGVALIAFVEAMTIIELEKIESSNIFTNLERELDCESKLEFAFTLAFMAFNIGKKCGPDNFML